jgi:hypothetical protein
LANPIQRTGDDIVRIYVLALSALALAACNPAPADDAAPADAHDMAGMDDTMKSADAADDANMAETPDGYTFHTYPTKVEKVHLPMAAGEAWIATASDTALVEVGEAKDETMPDGGMHHVVTIKPKKSGNATVKFERRASSAADAAVIETRTINFMVH